MRRRGLFAYDPLGGLSLIARIGDEIKLGVSVIGTIRAFEGQPQLNDLGEVVFQVDLSTRCSSGRKPSSAPQFQFPSQPHGCWLRWALSCGFTHSDTE